MFKTAAISVLGLMLGGIVGSYSGSAIAQDKELTIVATGGSFEKALRENFYEPFTKETGIKIRAIPASFAEQWTKVKAMSSANQVQWDIVSIYPEDMVSQAQYLADINCAALKNVQKEAVAGACKEKGLLRTIGGGTLVYSKKAFPNGGPTTWADFWDLKKYPGPRAFPNYGAPWWVLQAALSADGVPNDKLYPLDLDRAFKKLDEIKPAVKVWWKSGDQSQQIMRDGEVVAAMMWSGRAYSLVHQGLPLEVSWKSAPENIAMWGVLKGAPNSEAAMKFLDFFATRPEAHVAFGNVISYDTLNKGALELLKPEERKNRAIDPENAKVIAPVDAKWVAENRAAVIERWNAWLAK